jgi:hypothetical protein
VLSVENVTDDKSDISEEVDALSSAISRDNSLEVYDDKSLISLEVND